MERSFPKWSTAHQAAFNAIKGLVVSWECLMVIDHSNPGDNKIFVTTNTSDLRTGAVLSWGPSWELACPSLIMTSDGMEEYVIDKIIDEWCRGRGHQYLVHWVGYGPEEDRWLPQHKLDDCEALDTWQKREGAIV